MDLPSDFTFEISGQNKEMEVSLTSLKLALLLAIFLVYIVMASQFESFLHPLIILFTVPLAVIGVIRSGHLPSIPAQHAVGIIRPGPTSTPARRIWCKTFLPCCHEQSLQPKRQGAGCAACEKCATKKAWRPFDGRKNVT